MAERDTHRLVEQRRAKLRKLRDEGFAFPNDFRREQLTKDVHERFGGMSREDLEKISKDKKSENHRVVAVAGRMIRVRNMSKGSFVTLRDGSGDVQLWVRVDRVGEEVYRAFKTWDVGDIVGAEGKVFRTKKGELSVAAEELRLLTKSLRPLPEKFHGLTDVEARYRRRYLDLIMNEQVRDVFRTRSRMISLIRGYFDKKGFQEVETPMMQPLAGGAKARPFVTHHNALDRDLYLRVAPELYLKRLVIGGIEKVYEINRSFRNEGVSSRHNPEFTMLEFYQAYADYEDLMALSEDLLRHLCSEIHGSEVLESDGRTFDFSKPFTRISVADAVLENNENEGLSESDLDDRDKLAEFARAKGIAADAGGGERSWGQWLVALFEKTAEHKFEEPTFVIDYPAETSPLARRNDKDPHFADRFELFIGGQEIANGFSELNDPEDQRRRFERQMEERSRGDEEAMPFDEDYLTALEHGLPPTAGEGIGIDRLVMLFTGARSIRDVILFPHMKAETK